MNCVALVTAALAVVGGTLISGQRSDTRTIWDRVFSADQAERGRGVYTKACVYCHRVDLKGGTESGAPGLVGPSFLNRWAEKPVSDLFAKIAQTMPKDGTEWGGDPPAELSLEQDLD